MKRNTYTQLLTMMITLLFFINTISNVRAEGNYLAPPKAKGQVYFNIPEIMDERILANNTESYDILRWKKFTIQPTFQGTDKNGKSINIENPEGKWQVTGNNEVITTDGHGNFYARAIEPSSATVSFTYVYDGETFVGSVTFNVIKLKLKGNKDVLRYLALSQLAYTSIWRNYRGKTVDQVLAPKEAGGLGVTMSGDLKILKEGNEYSATFLDFVTSAAGDCVIAGDEMNGAYYVAKFRYGSKNILAFRGTTPTKEDYKTDVRLGLGLFEDNQFKQTIETLEQYRGTNTILTGHSLGGGLANYGSLLTGLHAVTFNAPSTIVTAVSNFAKGKTLDLPKNYRGLNDGLRTDYVNEEDWIGKLGAGDSDYGIMTGKGPAHKSGNVDRTIYVTNVSSNTPGKMPAHSLQMMLYYDYKSCSVSLSKSTGSTNPHDVQFTWEAHEKKYYFGSTDSETINVDNVFNSFVFAGDSDDTISIMSKLKCSSRLCGGRGDDCIISQGEHQEEYYWFTGHGSDTIIDNRGDDKLYIYGMDNITWNPEKPSENEDVCIYADTGEKIATLRITEGTGSFTIFCNGNKRWSMNRLGNRIHSYTIKCPVDVYINDLEGNVIQHIQDGAASSGNGAYGHYNVYADHNNEYTKVVTLTDPGYAIKIVGVGEGKMDYQSNYVDDTGENGWKLTDIPVHIGSVYYPCANYEDGIMTADLDGDGIIDYVPMYDKVTSIALPERVEMNFGTKRQLTPEIMPTAATPALIWSTSDPTIVDVDEDGNLSANGIGVATISVIADDESGQITSCEVVVPNEVISITDAIVTGLDTQYLFNGEIIYPEIQLSYRDIVLQENVHYQIEYKNNFMPGIAEIHITGIEPIQGTQILNFEIYDNEPKTVEEKVNAIVIQCREEGVKGEFDTAVWLHDWLTHNANYDYSYTEYQADGVILKGKGVCQSYTLAYQLLLDKVGIENVVISSTEMDHAWNLVKIDGEWCHVDCTWDDPGMGGQEGYTYFGMNDELMGRDHQWVRSDYPASTSLANYYLIRNKKNVVKNEAEFIACMEQQASQKLPVIECWYIGTDKNFNIQERFDQWYSENNWRFGLLQYSGSFDSFSMEVSMEYTDPWEKPPELENPVQGPKFALEGPEGLYRSENYINNGVVLIFGRKICSNTQSLIQHMEGRLPELYTHGVDVIINLMDAQSIEDLAEEIQQHPNCHYTYGDSRLMWDILSRVGVNQGIVFPVVAVIDKDGMIHSYSTDYVRDVDLLVRQALTVGTSHEIPKPEAVSYENKVNVDLSNVQDSSVANHLFQLSRQHGGVLYVYDQMPSADEIQLMDTWEKNIRMLKVLDMKMVACYEGFTETDFQQYRSQYPDIEFIQDDGRVFWAMLNAVDNTLTQAYYKCNYLINSKGQIIDYVNGSLLSVKKSATRIAKNMESVVRLPNTLKILDEEAFADCDLQKIDLSNTELSEIGGRAFADSPALRVVVLPQSVTQIADHAFDGCKDTILLCKFKSTSYDYAVAHNMMYLTY